MSTLPQVAHRASTWAIVLSLLMIVFGVFALFMPVIASIGVTLFVGWLMLFDGILQFVHAFQSKGVGHTAWKLLVALIYCVAGFYLVWHPVLGMASLTLVLAIFFFAEGIVDTVAYFSTRASGWMLLNGLVTILLGILIYVHWPSSSLWVIGTLLGISMIMTGTTRFMMAMALRRLTRGASGPTLQAGRAA
ncbi:MAG TPA: HdeD family acid-resistance protein [Terriglobales bacterium]